MGYHFKMEMIVPKRVKESHKTSEGLPISLPVAIPYTQNNIEHRGRMDSTVEYKNTVIHQHQIPGQN